MTEKGVFGVALACAVGVFGAVSGFAQDVPVRALELPPKAGNARNSEGAFITLKDGRILYVYSHFTGGGGDHDSAHLAGRYSADGGRTWTAQDRVIVPNEGRMNVMSVSLLRLRSGEIALFYLAKNSEKDCRPVMRLSRDEGETWGEPVMCVTDEVGYYVMNNDRAIQLAGGRLVLPLCLHWPEGQAKADWQGTLMCYLSDDNGKSWRRGRTAHKTFDATGRRVTTQEPGVVELKDGRVMMFIRASGGCQYLSWSADGGDTWTPPVPSDIQSPVSPASIKRLPQTGDLLLVWNNHDGIPGTLNNKRVPLSTAVSRDDGKTWQQVKVLEGNPNGHYCYIAIHPAEDAVLLGYCAMSGLGHSRITRVPVAWLYKEGGPCVSVIRKRPDLFGGAAAGPFRRLETALGAWTAEEGHAEIYGYARGRGIRLKGGTNRVVTLFLKEPAACGALGLGVERFASRPPYSLTLEAETGGAWRKVWEQKANTGVGTQHPVDWGRKANVVATRFRFTCTSTLGAIITDVPEIRINGFFKD